MFENWSDLQPAAPAQKDLHMSPKKFYPWICKSNFSVRIGNKLYIVKSKFLQYLEEESKKDKTKTA
jgi:hypothetical protein